jgi:hypothetical protein
MGNERSFANDDPRIKDLRSLRGQRGLTLAKVEKCASLMEELGVGAIDMETAIGQELQRMSNRLDVEALRYAYAIRDEHGATLKSRRASFKETLSKDSPSSDDTIEEWENDAIDELLKRLIARKHRPLPSAHYIIVMTAVFNEDQNLASLTEDHLIDPIGTKETVTSRSWVDRDGQGGVDTGRTFYYEYPRLPDESVQVHPVLIRILFSPMIPPPAAVYKREGATVTEAQVAHAVELDRENTWWTDGMRYYTYSVLLQNPASNWVVGFYWRHPLLSGDPDRIAIWREMGVDITTGKYLEHDVDGDPVGNGN